MVSFFDEAHSLVCKDNLNRETQININAKLIDIIKYDEKNTKKVFISLPVQLFSKTLPNYYSKSILQGIQNSYTTLDNSNELTNNAIKMLQKLSLKDILQLRTLQEELPFYMKYLTYLTKISYIKQYPI